MSRARNTAFLIFLFLDCLPLIGQTRDWTVRFSNGGEIHPVELTSVSSDSLTAVFDGRNVRLPISSMTWLQHPGEGGNMGRGAVAGALIGVGLGIIIGELEDVQQHNTNFGYSTSTTDHKILYGALGLAAGGLIGGTLGSVTGRSPEQAFDLRAMTVEQKSSVIATILTRAEPKPAGSGHFADHPAGSDMITMKSGDTLLGEIVELIPDSTVSIRTIGGEMRSVRMIDVGRISKVAEPAAPTTRAAVAGSPVVAEQLDVDAISPPGRMRLRVEVDGGIAVPTGDFGSTSSQYGGGATTGYFLGLNFDVGGSSMAGWYTTAVGAINGIDASSLNAAGSGVALDVGHYTSWWLMTGFRIRDQVSDVSSLFWFGQIGGLFGSSPEIRGSGPAGSAVLGSGTGSSFGYGGGMGVIFNDKLTLKASLYHGEPEYALTLLSTSGTLFLKAKQPTSLFHIGAGYQF